LSLRDVAVELAKLYCLNERGVAFSPRQSLSRWFKKVRQVKVINIKQKIQRALKLASLRIYRRADGFFVIGRLHKRKVDREALAALSPILEKRTEWSLNSDRLSTLLTGTASGKIWADIPGGHKWIDYFPIYDREFSEYRGKNTRILEIGVYKGASLRLWKKFFGDKSTVVGIDIDENCRSLGDAENGIQVRIGSQTDESFLNAVALEFGPFDIIIDDGSHAASHQIASFNILFHKALEENGTYFIEDLEGNYWGDKTGQLDQRVSTIDLLKTLIDAQNIVFEEHSYSDFFISGRTLKPSFSVPLISTMVERITFYTSVAVIKKTRKAPPLGYHL